ncbi:MAG TPA: helix-turn-helix domain-containing protein [Anaerolineae bacterium]|nr:helix-turn-helix domain-containing protein [Anaerolineae bacterium]
MVTSVEKPENWLSLKDAAEKLDVHPATLRRWANKGSIACATTPGGHRRFRLSDVEQLLRRRLAKKDGTQVELVWAETALQKTRQAITRRPEQTWLMAHQDEAVRAQSRRWGQQLMGLTMQYIAADDDCAAILGEAEGIGRSYAVHSLALGLPLTEALQAVLFFRDTLVETAVQMPANAQRRPEANVQLMRRINELLNAVHLAIAAVYEEKGSEGETL